ncbi:MAG: hypothetical protein K2L88_03565 [Clostridiales bacterium]|nr:hypothetical protein [Clostridiales bacterium]
MRKKTYDLKSCETCGRCKSLHVIMNGELGRGMLHICKLRNKIVDQDDKCRKWQKSELLCASEQEDMSAILAQLKERYNY